MSKPHLARSVLSLLTLLCAAACGDDHTRGGNHDAGPDAQARDSSVGDDDAGPDGGQPGDADLGDRAGTRLHPIGVAVDGMVHRSDIRDDLLGVNCGFIDLSPDDSDDVQHCVPHALAELRFANSDCTGERLLVKAHAVCLGAEGPGDIVRVAGVSACGAHTMGARRLGAVATDAKYYLRTYGSAECVEADVGTATVYMPEALELSALVGGRVEAVPSGEPGLELERIAGSDGSRFPLGLRWSDGTRCDPQALGSDDEAAAPCVPRDALFASDNTYADNACSEPVFSSLEDACGGLAVERSYGLIYDDVDGCQRPSALYALGAALDTFYLGPPDTCSEPKAVAAGTRLFARGEARAFSTLPSTLRRFHGSSRLRMAHLSTHAGEPIMGSPELFDTELDETCLPRRFTDGSTRCMPTTTLWDSGLFADDGCTVPAYVNFVGGCNPARERQRFVIRDQDAAEICSERPITEIRRAVPHTGAVYFRSGDDCAERPLDPTEAAYTDGEVIDLSTLAEVTEVGR